jgi:RecA/RadA recombinase
MKLISKINSLKSLRNHVIKESAMQTRPLLKSGCLALDEAMQGGLKDDDVVQVYGPSGVGKTTLALQYATSALRQGLRVLFFDTERAFSLARFQQLVSSDFDLLAPLLSIVSPSSFLEQAELIAQLGKLCPSNVHLLVFDTIVSLYRLELGEFEENIRLNRLLSRQLGEVAAFAKARKLAVVLINQVRGDAESPDGFSPVADSIVSFWSTARIRIAKAESMGYREFKIAGRSSTESKVFLAKLGNSGFE